MSPNPNKTNPLVSNGDAAYTKDSEQKKPQDTAIRIVTRGECRKPATQFRKRAYRFGVFAIWLGFLSEIAYAGFTTQDGAVGIAAGLQNLFDFPGPYTATTQTQKGLNPQTLWTQAQYLIPAAFLAWFCDLGMNLNAMRPKGDSRAVVSLEKESDGQLTQIDSEKKNYSLPYQVSMFVCGGLALFNFMTGALTDPIAINTFFKEVAHLEGAQLQAATWGVAGPLSLGAVAYYIFLSFRDVLIHLDEIAKGSKSMFAELYRLSKLQCLKASIQSFVTMGYRALVFGLITHQFCTDIMNSPDSLTNALTGTAVLAGGMTSLLTRTMSAFNQYLSPFDRFRDKDGVYDLASFNAYRKGIWKALKASEKIGAIVPAAILALLYEVPIFYLLHQYAGDLLKEHMAGDMAQFLQVLCAGLTSLPLVFIFIMRPDMTNALDRVARKKYDVLYPKVHENTNNETIPGNTAKFLASFMTGGSQFVRFLIGLAAAKDLHKYTGISIDRATMSTALLGAPVGLTQYLYYKPKVAVPVQENLNELNKLWRAVGVFCSRNRKAYDRLEGSTVEVAKYDFLKT